MKKTKFIINKMFVKYAFQTNSQNPTRFFVVLAIVKDLVVLYITIACSNGVKQRLKRQNMEKLHS